MKNGCIIILCLLKLCNSSLITSLKSANSKVPKLNVQTSHLLVKNKTYIDIEVGSKLELECVGDHEIA